MKMSSSCCLINREFSLAAESFYHTLHIFGKANTLETSLVDFAPISELNKVVTHQIISQNVGG